MCCGFLVESVGYELWNHPWPDLRLASSFLRALGGRPAFLGHSDGVRRNRKPWLSGMHRGCRWSRGSRTAGTCGLGVRRLSSDIIASLTIPMGVPSGKVRMGSFNAKILTG